MVFGKLFGEFVDVIAWTDDSADTMVWRFERHGNEIKYGAKLTVRESQIAVFVNEGRVADVFQPGMYTLETQNLPIFSTLDGWQHGFQSPFKAEVYFINARRFTGLKWGTKNPVLLRDAEFGAVRLRAFGTYVVRVSDPVSFIKEIVGTDGHFTTGEIADQLRDMIVARFGTVLAGAGVPVLDLAANYDHLSEFLTNRMRPEIAAYGIELCQLFVENISLPPEVEKALDKRTSMGVLGDLRTYAQFQAAEAITAAAANPSGTAAAGVGLGAGMAMAGQIASAMAPGAASPATPPPLPQAQTYFIAVEGRQQGPFAPAALTDAVSKGILTRETLIWTKGMAGWAKAGDQPELASLFADMPPPLPPT